ncbi:MAG: hypothetical protein Q9174_005616, partial [Haloplaca sp. 1 TL-2023]
MPRKAFVADLQHAVEHFSHPGAFELAAGVEDGSLTFKYELQGPPPVVIVVQALVTDVGDYPSSHMYMIYTTSENVPAHISTALEDIGTLDGLPVSQMLAKVVKVIDTATVGSQDSPHDVDEDSLELDDAPSEPSEAELSEDAASDMDEDWSPRLVNSFLAPRTSGSVRLSSNARIRSDLRIAKAAGFRVGYLGGLSDEAELCIITISVRVSKLGISEEAMQAWHMDPSKYVILLIRYTAGYRSLEELLNVRTSNQAPIIAFRVGLSHQYKVSMEHAVKAFVDVKKHDKPSMNTDTMHDEDRNSPKGLQPLFVGRPLEDLLNERLLALIDYRNNFGMAWQGAEAWYIDHQGSNWSTNEGIDGKYYGAEFSARAATLPGLVTNDHLGKLTMKPSLPLIAMQFTLRHLVRCTEFCLVCHSRVETDFEALKPYVCSKPLCLYQYMAFGFGPSIEHDIISQPHVVDLLISFCYCGAAAGRLKHLPDGMSLSVPAPSLMPPVPRPGHSSRNTAPVEVETPKQLKKSYAIKPTHPPKAYKAKFDPKNWEIILDPGETLLYPNQWIFVKVLGKMDQQFHCKVIEAMHPAVRLGPPIECVSRETRIELVENTRPSASPAPRGGSTGPSSRPSGGKDPAPSPNRPMMANTLYSLSSSTATYTPGKLEEVEFIIYDQNFDDLETLPKQSTICMLLDTLPSVDEMKVYLSSQSGKGMTIASWQDRISPAAAGVLRWIIASNRSCIVEVDTLKDGSLSASEERVTNMPQWMQFRFAQGAPDKEQRFVQSIRDITGQSKHPSLYAWHGSPLHNWHSIVREGLHFQDTAHGRAYGHGVYHSLNVQTSIGYSQGIGQSISSGYSGWPQSSLQISHAVALNEIVNAPNQFVSKSPHLVVAQLDWIQTRYLFVQITSSIPFGQEVAPKEVYVQDPGYTPTGSTHSQIAIPITAVCKSRRPIAVKTGKGEKKLKVAKGAKEDDAILLSDDTDIEDLQILLSDDEQLPASQSNGTKPTDKALPKPPSLTDFVPGTLDPTSLPLMDPPPFATTAATKALQRELSSTLKSQDSQPPHELG